MQSCFCRIFIFIWLHGFPEIILKVKPPIASIIFFQCFHNRHEFYPFLKVANT